MATDLGHERPRLRVPDRKQMFWEPWCLDERLEAGHPARTIWQITGRLDLSAFYATIEARGESPGRAATDPRLLVALWLYAATEGVGGGRELDRLCKAHDAYRWLCGEVSVNYHTLNDFRVTYEAAVDDLLTQVLAMLMRHDVVQVKRISQDGTRVRASAGTGSFRRRPTLDKMLQEAKAHVQALKAQGELEPAESNRRRAAQERAAREQVERVEAALKEMTQLEAVKASEQKRKPASKQQPPRTSTTDPQARKMKMPNGGFAPAYNVQIASDPKSRAIVGIDVTNHGTDHGEDAPLREQVERRTGQKVHEHLLDGGYVKGQNIDDAARDGVAIFAPLPATGPGGSVLIDKSNDSPAVAAWRERMQTPTGQTAYKERGSTSETVNADLKTFRGLESFAVRGLTKVRCVVLWSALAYNLMHYGNLLTE
jgi:transposase